MHKKLYSYNDGLKSRFAEINFEDFEESELKEIWDQLLKDRGWTAEDKVGLIVSKRLTRGAKRKGFGNARGVRRIFEGAVKKAMSRDDWTGDNLQAETQDVIGECPSSDNPKLRQILDEFKGRIGCSSVKKSVQELVALAEQNYHRELQGTPPLSFPLHKMFLGNPGTGKTTCAKLYGRFLKAIGILSIGEVVEKTASDFIGQFVGQSATKTNNILASARGKVLIIDEAYALNDQMYGRQVLDTLVEKVQCSNDDMAVLLLGYEPQMLQMMRDQNPGLSRRFPEAYAFRFEDYNEGELTKIFIHTCKDHRVEFAPEVLNKVHQVLSRQKALPNFGNAGAVIQLFENAAKKATARQTGNGNFANEIQLEPEDLEAESDPEKDDKKDPLAPLEGLFKVENIKTKLEQLRNTLTVARNVDKNPDVGHFVLRGPPGTGKTTVARSMAETRQQQAQRTQHQQPLLLQVQQQVQEEVQNQQQAEEKQIEFEKNDDPEEQSTVKCSRTARSRSMSSD